MCDTGRRDEARAVHRVGPAVFAGAMSLVIVRDKRLLVVLLVGYQLPLGVKGIEGGW